MGNSFNTWIKGLKSDVFGRRQAKQALSRSAPDHPERIPPNDSTTVNQFEHQSESPTDSTVPAVPVEASSNKCSDFYWACRNGDTDQVKRLIKTMRGDQVDRLEPNGSTALHSACYYGHRAVVILLLEAGADRAIQNKHGCLPFDEANNDDIRDLFSRIPSCNRFISNAGALEWDLVDEEAQDKAEENRSIIKSIYDKGPMIKLFERIEKNYINKELNNFNGIEDIKRFFQKATEEEDPIWIIKAYTAETDFYKILNAEIAGGTGKCESERRYIIALLSYHPKLEQFSYTGSSYRVMQLNDDSIKRYQPGSTLMTKSFVSSSIDQKVALWILSRHELAREESGQTVRRSVNGKMIKQWVMCKYQIKHRRTALHIENASQYVSEGEVLIMPYAVFRVKQSKETKLSDLPGDYMITEIELEQYDQ